MILSDEFEEIQDAHLRYIFDMPRLGYDGLPIKEPPKIITQVFTVDP